MATFTLTRTDSYSTSADKFRLKVTYTKVSDTRIQVTKIEGCRTDAYTTTDNDITLSIGGVAVKGKTGYKGAHFGKSSTYETIYSNSTGFECNASGNATFGSSTSAANKAKFEYSRLLCITDTGIASFVNTSNNTTFGIWNKGASAPTSTTASTGYIISYHDGTNTTGSGTETFTDLKGKASGTINFTMNSTTGRDITAHAVPKTLKIKLYKNYTSTDTTVAAAQSGLLVAYNNSKALSFTEKTTWENNSDNKQIIGYAANRNATTPDYSVSTAIPNSDINSIWDSISTAVSTTDFNVKEKVLYCIWGTKSQFTVTYNANGATINSLSGWTISSDKKTATKKFYDGDTLGTISGDIKLDGFAENGVWTAASGGTQVSSTYAITKAQTLYQHWNAMKVTMIFHRNTSSSDTTTISQTYTAVVGDSAQPIPDAVNNWSYTGYNKKSWNKAADGSGDGYEINKTFNNSWINGYGSVAGKSLDFYLIWQANTYIVDFWDNGASLGKSETMTYNTAKALTSASDLGISKQYWNFAGWSTDEYDVTPNYTDAQSVKNLATSGTIKLYAVYSRDIIARLTSVETSESEDHNLFKQEYNSSGGTMTGASTYFPYCSLTREGYELIKFEKDGQYYYSGATYEFTPSENESPILIYKIIWKKLKDIYIKLNTGWTLAQQVYVKTTDGWMPGELFGKTSDTEWK